MIRGPASSASHAVLALLAALLAAAGAFAQGSRVEITGGRDASGQNYRWKVTNRSGARITRVEFPHFKADMWTVPPGWQQHATNLHGHTGTTGTSGICTAFTDDSLVQLRDGDSAEFAMRVGRGLSNVGVGAVTVHFSDGSRVVVQGVELPSAPSLFERYLWVIGFGIILLAFIWMGARQRRRSAAAAAHPPGPGGEVR
ncbi:MAG: hypothetical protein LC135_16475 [Phycisphaerae bacterium]|nr:hypothetical protein [Phycisphaerae bacterium]MCZ2401435.1 hypothetical protein [Phycisphaerae bacterium]NUQ49572.1 hypothetical protein [Phycisphaerae bacterium]